MALTTPQVEEWLRTQPQINTMYQDFINMLRRRKIRGSDRCSRETLQLMKRMLGSCRWQNTQQMMDHVRAGKQAELFCTN
jgi:translation initiation factor 2B subunit (eIF-2B alpha/beta/delta family)